MVNYDALGSEEFQGAKAAPAVNKRWLLTLDYPRLKAETGIEKIKLAPSLGDDHPYVFSFLPFPVTSSHPKYRHLKGVFKDSPPVDWKLNLTFHKVSTPTGNYKVLCNQKNYGEACPFCEKKQDLFNRHDGNYNAMSTETQNEVKSLNDTERDFFFILNHADGKIYVMEYASYYFGETLNKKMSRSHRGESSIILAHPGPGGHDLEFYIEPSSLKDNRGNFLIGPIQEMEFVSRKEAIDPEILESVPALDKYIKKYTYEELESMLDGTYFITNDGDEEEDTESAPEPEVATQREPRRPQRPVPEEKVPEEEPSSRIVLGKPLEEEDSREARRRRREEKSMEKEEVACPAGGTFGKDIDGFNECDDCPIYDECEKEYERTKTVDDELSIL